MMEDSRSSDAMLAPYRVLDLTNERGLIAGKLLGDLGANVIKVEPPGGDLARRLGPFYHDQPHIEHSLYWKAFNLNKRGITLNLESADGRDLFRRLVATADFVLESYAPGYLAGLGLSYEALRNINPRIIVTSITPFGQSGPYRDFEANDLILEALGGFMYLTGDADRAPVRISFPLAYCHAGAEAATASVMAHYHRERTGHGQFIDVSMQECIVWTTMNATGTWDLLEKNIMRGAATHINPQTGLQTRSIWPCKDGYVAFTLASGARATGSRALVRWMQQEGEVSTELLQMDWASFDLFTIKQDTYDQFSGEIDAFFRTKTMAELYERAAREHMVLAPVFSPKEILESPQLQAREYFVELDHPELGQGVTLRYPGAFAKTSVASPRIQRRAPLVGEHNREIYCDELKVTSEQLVALTEAGII